MNNQDIESYVKDLVSKPEVVPPRTYRKTGELKMDRATHKITLTVAAQIVAASFILLLFREVGMNKDNAAKWIALGSAMLQGKTIQRLDKREWVDVLNLNTISYDPESYRIKPETKKAWCRMVLLKPVLGSKIIDIVTTSEGESYYTNHVNFIRWLTDRIEFEIPE
jgi:hypothetical protein